MASTQSRTSMKDVSQVTSYSSNTPSALRKYDLAILRNLEHKNILSELRSVEKDAKYNKTKGEKIRFKKRIRTEVKPRSVFVD